MTTVTVALNGLQELENYMRQMVDQGLTQVQRREGRGLPTPPPAAAPSPTNAAFIQGAPSLELNIAAELAQQDLEAEAAEREAKQATGQRSAQVFPVCSRMRYLA